MTIGGPALLIAVLALGSILGAELLPAAAPNETPAAATVPAEPPRPMEAPPVAAWANVALARPLFAPDRRAAQSAPGQPAALPRLAGTIRSADGVVAIFAAAGEGRPLILGPGAQVAGWEVSEIADGAVTVTRGGARSILRVSYAGLPAPAQPIVPPGATLLHERHTSPFLQP